MSELAVYQPATEVTTRPLDDWIPVLSQVVELASQIHNSPFVPDGLRGSVPAVAAAILAGRELGLGPMTSLANIHVIKGKTGLSALLMRALILAQGHDWQDVDVTDTRAIVRGRRKGETDWTEASFTRDQAKTAGIQLGGYPQDKLYARATVRLARRKFADVIAGMPYAAEELEDGFDHDTGTEPPASNGTAPETKPRTAQSKARKPHVDQGEQGINLPPAQQTYDGPPQPPLPGEEQDSSGPAQDGGNAAGPEAKPSKLTGIIRAHFKRLGFDDDEREQRLVATAVLAGRDEITSTNDLTEQEKSTVADALSRCRDRGRLIELLTAAENAAHDGD